jgi:integrase
LAKSNITDGYFHALINWLEISWALFASFLLSFGFGEMSTEPNQLRGKHAEYIFTYNGNRVQAMNNSAWQKARKRAGLQVRIHDLKHTSERRLRVANVSFEDRQDLLGHKSSRITDHYSSAELSNLIAAAEKVCVSGLRKSHAVI